VTDKRISSTPASDSLRSEHRAIEAELDRLLDALLHMGQDRLDDIRHSVAAIRSLAVRHFAKEEEVLYPRLRIAHRDLLARLEEQHEDTREFERHLDEVLASLDTPPGERQLAELHHFGIEFHDAIQCHIVEEEDHLLCLADEELSFGEQQSLWASMNSR
jgi:hemerythrin-like domain-containing protein